MHTVEFFYNGTVYLNNIFKVRDDRLIFTKFRSYKATINGKRTDLNKNLSFLSW